jgi:hypothetical protein
MGPFQWRGGTMGEGEQGGGGGGGQEKKMSTIQEEQTRLVLQPLGGGGNGDGRNYAEALVGGKAGRGGHFGHKRWIE